jgi:uncharacterized RDD family membrane protein YckC
MVYDGMLVVAIWLVTLFPLVAITNGAAVGPTVQTLLFLEMYAFFVYFWLARGQTAGMVAWRLALRSADGEAMTLKQVTWRFFAALLCFASLGLGYLWILFDPHKRSWADRLSGTEVVVLPKKPR